jgi:hypothetical protein
VFGGASRGNPVCGRLVGQPGARIAGSSTALRPGWRPGVSVGVRRALVDGSPGLMVPGIVDDDGALRRGSGGAVVRVCASRARPRSSTAPSVSATVRACSIRKLLVWSATVRCGHGARIDERASRRIDQHARAGWDHEPRTADPSAGRCARITRGAWSGPHLSPDPARCPLRGSRTRPVVGVRQQPRRRVDRQTVRGSSVGVVTTWPVVGHRSRRRCGVDGEGAHRQAGPLVDRRRVEGADGPRGERATDDAGPASSWDWPRVEWSTARPERGSGCAGLGRRAGTGGAYARVGRWLVVGGRQARIRRGQRRRGGQWSSCCSAAPAPLVPAAPTGCGRAGGRSWGLPTCAETGPAASAITATATACVHPSSSRTSSYP